MDSAPNGLMYFASDRGLLEYDGHEWRLFYGSKGITRSVFVHSDSLIYTGSDLDFGKWEKDELGYFTYTSLYPFQEELSALNEEFWTTLATQNEIYFTSSSNIYVLKNGNLTKIVAPSSIQKSYNVNGSLFFSTTSKQLYILKNLEPKLVVDFSRLPINQLVAVEQYGDALLLVSTQSGVYIWDDASLSALNTNLNQKLESAKVFSFSTLRDQYYAFGSISNGVFVTNKQGEIIHHINKPKGLLNNTILSIHFDANSKLWLGLDYGVSMVHLDSRYSYVYDYKGVFGTAYAAAIEADDFYLGTNQGLYHSSWGKLDNKNPISDFDLIPYSNGQVWDVGLVDGQLLVAHDKGLFELQDKELRPISERTGYWTFLEHKGILFAGTYNGISLFKKERGQWTYIKNIEGILGSCNQLFLDDQERLWVLIPNYAVVKIELDEDLNTAKRQNYLISEPITEDFQFTYDEGILAIANNEFAYSYTEEVDGFKKRAKAQTISPVAELYRGNAKITDLKNGFKVIPIYNGFALENTVQKALETRQTNSLLIRKVEAFQSDSTRQIIQKEQLDFEWNNLRFHVLVANQDAIYQYRLSSTKSWTNFHASQYLELIDLNAGNYVIEFRANVDGVWSEAVTFSFQIAQPWYLSYWAFLMYLSVLLMIWFASYYWREHSMNQQKMLLLEQQERNLRLQEEKHQKEMRRLEREKLQMEYEELKDKLKAKTLELAAKAKDNDEKNALIQELKDKIEQIQNNPETAKSRAKELQRILEHHEESPTNNFETQLDELHQEFYKKLKDIHSDLTLNDIRLCAHIRSGFNAKEIADILHIKPSSVYISRSRLRKKLNLGADDDLYTYLSSL